MLARLTGSSLVRWEIKSDHWAAKPIIDTSDS
jgi:hypothetical protein